MDPHALDLGGGLIAALHAAAPEHLAVAAQQGERAVRPAQRSSRRMVVVAGVEPLREPADVLTLFTKVDTPDPGVTEIATHLGLSKAVVHLVLTTLTAKGFIEADAGSRRYRLGPMVLALGVTYIDQIDLRTIAMPRLGELSERMGELSERTQETSTLSLRYGPNRIYVDQVTPDREVKMEVVLGRPFPLHAGSSSKAFLAFLSTENQERYINEHTLEVLTDRTITDPDALRAELARIRERATPCPLASGKPAGSAAAPIFDHRREPVASISVCGPLERFRDEVDFAAKALMQVTSDLSRQLGCQPLG